MNPSTAPSSGLKDNEVNRFLRRVVHEEHLLRPHRKRKCDSDGGRRAEPVRVRYFMMSKTMSSAILAWVFYG